MDQLKAGHEPAWDDAFQVLWPIAYAAAHARLGTSFPGDVEDVAITAIRGTAEEVERVGTFAELKALTRVIAERRALDHIRRRQTERRGAARTESSEGRDDLVAPQPGTMEQVEAADLARILVALTESLSPSDRELLSRYYAEGLTQAELSKTLGIPMGTIGVQLSRALQKLRSALEKHPELTQELREKLRCL